jgi:hypothetical protein
MEKRALRRRPRRTTSLRLFLVTLERVFTMSLLLLRIAKQVFWLMALKV